MTTNYSKLILASIIFVFSGALTLNAQSLFDLAPSSDDGEPISLTWSADFDYGDTYDALDAGIKWAPGTLGGSAGLAYADNDGFSETTFCFGAEYLHRISPEYNPNGASYIGAFANYHNTSSDSFDQNSFRFGLRYTYHDRISAFNRFHLIYGVKGSYETGSREFSNVEEDLSGFNVSGIAGIGVRVCDNFSIGAELPVINFASRTFENNGVEVDTDATWIGLNKNNPVMAYARWHLGGKKNNN